MGTFNVKAVHKDGDGSAVDLVLDAADEHEAIDAASSQGFVVESVTPTNPTHNDHAAIDQGAIVREIRALRAEVRSYERLPYTRKFKRMLSRCVAKGVMFGILAFIIFPAFFIFLFILFLGGLGAALDQLIPNP